MNFFSSFVVVQDRTYGNLQNDLFALASGSIRAFPMPAALSFIFGIEAEVHQSIVAFTRFHDYVAPFAAISARWTTSRNVLFPSESHATVSAIARFDSNFSLVDEHQNRKQRSAPSYQQT